MENRYLGSTSEHLITAFFVSVAEYYLYINETIRTLKRSCKKKLPDEIKIVARLT